MIYKLLPIILIFISGCMSSRHDIQSAMPTHSAIIRANLENAALKKVFVVAHRAAWKNAPENSLSAVLNAINLGVDVIEIDVRKTSLHYMWW